MPTIVLNHLLLGELYQMNHGLTPSVMLSSRLACVHVHVHVCVHACMHV